MSEDKKYAVHSMFLTCVGEGYHTGKLAVFCRLSGCNVWSGREGDRARDGVKNSVCALHCDTEFFGVNETQGGGHFTALELVDRLLDLWPHGNAHPRVVLTGGEPTLQLDDALALEMTRRCYVQVETNGTKPVPRCIPWVTLSPKPPMPLSDARLYNEVKVLYPLYDPTPYATLAYQRYLQPVDYTSADNNITRRTSLLNRESVAACFKFIQENPAWRVSCQAHKLWGMP